jgi:hypothetical protein
LVTALPSGASPVWPTGQDRPRTCSASAVAGKIAGMRRKRLLLGVFVIAAVLVTAYPFIPVGEGRFGQATCDKIELGWTTRQVEELLGDRGLNVGTVFLDGGYIWSDDESNEIYVEFDSQFTVKAKLFIPSKLSPVERLKGRIQRRLKAVLP